MTYTAHVYPHPDPADHGWTEVIEIFDAAGNMVDDDGDVRDHPEVPLSDDQLDDMLTRLRYRRLGPWKRTPDGCADVLVEPTRGTPVGK